MPFVHREDGVITGAYAVAQSDFATEFLADDDPEYLAFLASQVPPRTISLTTLQERIEAEGAWDTYVNFMFANPGRRNAFLKTMFMGRPLQANDAQFRNSLLNVGLTQAAVDRIMA